MNESTFGWIGARTGKPPRAWLAIGLVLCWLPAAAADGQSLVTIEGGARSDNPQFYHWEVTNHHSSPIIYIEFPQYHGDTFNPPAGWSQDWKNQRKLKGGEDAPGWVRTSVEQAGDGIAPGRSAAFEMRISREGALPRTGVVTVRFADDTESLIAGVELPSAKSFLEQNIMAMAMAAIFLVALLLHSKRRKTIARKQNEATTSAQE